MLSDLLVTLQKSPYLFIIQIITSLSFKLKLDSLITVCYIFGNQKKTQISFEELALHLVLIFSKLMGV